MIFSRPDLENIKQKIRHSITQDVLRAFNQLNATTLTDQSPPSPSPPPPPPIETSKPNELEVIPLDNDTSGYASHEDPSIFNNRISSKVTFESLIRQTSVPSSPKTKDQSVMAQMDHKGRLNNTTSTTTTTTLTSEQTQDSTNENKNGRMPLMSEGTITSGSTSAKSSVKELVGNQQAPNHRKSKSQNRARKALRTITFILGNSFLFTLFIKKNNSILL